MNEMDTDPSLTPRQRARMLLHSRGIAPTQQRVEIAQVMFACPQHLSAEQVLNIVNRDEAHVSKATVYNTLNLFAREGLLREVFVDPERVFYDSNVGPHHHFYNIDTGLLADVPAEQFDIRALPIAPEGTRLEGVDVIVRVRNN